MGATQFILLVGLATVGLSAVLCLLGAIRMGRSRGWERTTGIVVDKRTGETSGPTQRFATYRFRDRDGQEHQHTSAVAEYRVLGSPVPVRYDPADPSRSALDTVVGNGKAYFAAAGGVLVFYGMVTAVMYLIITIANAAGAA